MNILKKNNKIVEFKKEKIVDGIIKAMIECEKGIDEDLAWNIAEEIELEIEDKDVITSSETIQDRIEELLSINGRFDVSKTYILYRDKKRREREKGWELNDLQRDIYEKKYRHDNESFDEFLDRVSAGDKDISKLIREKKLLPAGRILAGRGLHKKGKKITYSNCYVLPKPEDNIESIFDTAKYLARTFSYGGGVGIGVSNLRPKGAIVNNAAQTTAGVIPFMDLYSTVTSIIGMKGRRGALMLNLDISHPDIEDFISIKSDLEKMNSANISINMTNEFMEAVNNGSKYNLEFKVKETGELIKKQVDARELFDQIAKNNWDMAEPGLLFQDTINYWHLMSEDEDFEFAGVNPCAEETLPAFGSCNLASINLSEFVSLEFTDKAKFNFEEFKEVVSNGVKFLNEVLDENMELHPLKEQREVSKKYRQIGLGVMGVADLFIKLGIRYGSKESIRLVEKIGFCLVNQALQQSSLLAKKHGPFPACKKEKILKSPFLQANASKETMELIELYGLRNSQILTIAPTGSISTLIGCSNGVEPMFQISYKRKTESLNKEDVYYDVFTPIVQEYMAKNKVYKNEDLPSFFVTSGDLNYMERIDVQATWQRFIDASISSTVNVPNDFTVDEVKDLYMYAWRKGVKGTTIYRDGCSRSGVLVLDKNQSLEEEIRKKEEELNRLIAKSLIEDPNKCPKCSGNLIMSGGCSECQDCGYSPCSI